jgi:HEAT repeat protein
MKFSTSEDDFLATVAIWATLKINPGETSMFEVAIPRLRKALRSERQLVRLEAAVALGDIGPAARSAVPILELVAEDDPLPVVRDAAEEALKKIRGSVSPAS